MKKSFLLSLFLLSAAIIKVAHAQTPVYVTITSHNEDSDYNIPFGSYNTNSVNSKNLYLTIRNRIIQVADSIKKYNAAWNYQSDWRFLRGVIMWDTNSTKSNTNNLNILEWMTNVTYNNGNIELDCHSHESMGYNYADVAYLYSLCNVTPSPVVGGFDQTGTRWHRFRDSDTSNLNNSFLFTFQYLSHGSPGHPNDDVTYGAWKPTNNSAVGNSTGFYTHNTSNNLTYLGNGCNDLHVGDSTSTTTKASQTYIQSLLDLITAIDQGDVPPGIMYSCHIQLDQKYFLSTNYMKKIGEILAILKPYADNGKIIWATHSEKVTAYNNTFSGGSHQTNCNDVVLGITQPSSNVRSIVLPNPNQGEFKVQLNSNELADLKVINMFGELIEFNLKPNGDAYIIELPNVPNGVYSLKWKASSERFVVQQ